MTWFKVDDSFYDHPKVFDAPDCAVALWVRAGSWSARNLTDGHVPTKMPARLCDDPETAVRELVDRGLWRRAKGGYQFHDWTSFQPSKEEAIAAKEKKSSGGRIGNHRRWHVSRGVIDPDCPYCQGKRPSDNRSDPDRYTNTGTESHPNPPVPSRPEGTRTDTGSQSSSRRNARAWADDDDSIDLGIVELLTELTGRNISILDATKIRQRILGSRQIKSSRAAYVAAAIQDNPSKFLPAHQEGEPDGPHLRVVPDRPTWCGTCDERTRLLDVPGAPVARCPVCHPLESRRPAS